MAKETVRILPERINPEWLEVLYQQLTEEGQIEVDNFLKPQDLEINEKGKVGFIPIHYTLPQTAKAEVLFADGHTEDWQVAFLQNRKLAFIDHDGNRYDTLYSLRPTEHCDAGKIIIEITLHATHNIIGF